jgi:hypothetical protein
MSSRLRFLKASFPEKSRLTRSKRNLIRPLLLAWCSPKRASWFKRIMRSHSTRNQFGLMSQRCPTSSFPTQTRSNKAWRSILVSLKSSCRSIVSPTLNSTRILSPLWTSRNILSFRVIGPFTALPPRSLKTSLKLKDVCTPTASVSKIYPTVKRSSTKSCPSLR